MFWKKKRLQTLSFFFKKVFENTICYVSLQSLQNHTQGPFFNGQSSSFNTFLALNGLRYSFPGFNHHQPSPSCTLGCLISPFLSLFISFPLSFRFSIHPFYSTMSAPKYQRDTNRDFCILLFNTLQREECHANFPREKYMVLYFLQWVRESTNDDAK